MDRLAAGVLLVNHWQQKLVLLTKYDPLTGAAGAVLNARSLRTFATSALTETSLRTPESNLSSLAQQLVVGEEDVLTWPPLALEFEIQAKKWQMVEVSPSMLTPAVLSKLPASMPTALWEIVCLCLLRVEEDSTVLQALLDTGISPRQGFLAYLRLLHRVLSRTETFDDIPGYRQIMNMKV